MKNLLAMIVLTFCAQAMSATKGYSQTEDYAGCSGIQNSDKKLYCQAMDSNKQEFCTRIGNNDLQNKCMAKVNNDVKYCKRISDEKKRINCEQYIR